MTDITARYVEGLKTAHRITDRFEAEYGRPPTREECAIAAALFIEGSKHQSRSAAPQPGPAHVDSAPIPAGVPDTCPKCRNSEMWDNRRDKRSTKSPDFRCKDKENCDHAIWLNPLPKGGKSPAKVRPQGPIADPDDELPW